MSKENLMTVSYDDDSYFVNENMSCYEFEFLKGCIKKLKVDDQEILYLKFSCGLEYSEISKTLGITSATARKRLQYAKNRLKILLEKGDL
ncbi:RNA polymerase sigma factor [Ruminococcus sp.]|uniref:RNA polymerase sigma factor n=1 Tax=Ruminococcus sp. TaxID=41978 RepID=UPI003AF6D243